MNYSENKSSHSLHYIYNIIMHNNKFFINLLASVNNFYCLVRISFKQLLISIHSLKLFSVCMCVCVHVYMNECSSVLVCEGVSIHMGALAWRLEIDIRHLPLFFLFNFMGLSLMEQEYQASRPKDHFASTQQ